MKTDRRSVADIAAGLARRRITRFALVGGICIPFNVGLLWLLHTSAHLPVVSAWVLAFESSALFNFYANQRFTYREQQFLRGWDWPKRALKAQVSSIVGVAINVSAFGILLAGGVPYLSADAAGIVVAFAVNFTLAEHFVFTAPAQVPADRPIMLGNQVER
jgi:putative flippase GtrA